MLARAQRVLVETLFKLDILDEVQAQNLIDNFAYSGSDLEEILSSEYGVEPEPMLMAKARSYRLSPINLKIFKINDQCFEYLDPSFCKKPNIVPVGEVGSYIAVAAADPLDPELTISIEQATKKPFYFLIALESQISEIFDEGSKSDSLPTIDFGEVVEALGMQFDIDVNDIDEKDFESEESAPVVLLANRVIEDAYFSRASDIHIEPFERETRIRIRVDGILRVKLTLPRSVSQSLISRLKVMANLDVAERRRWQDGRIPFRNYNRKGIDVDLRISTSPMTYGEGCVMRILDMQRSTLPLSDLGFTNENLEKYRKIIKFPHGMILHCGPTGSGKSMTLYSALNEINSSELCVRTAEDPVEYTLPGIIQVQMNRQIGITFAGALRAFLRQDPDIILLGEIRDEETARIATEAAMTGHLLFSTIHTNDAAGTISRLTELGIEPFMISSALLCVCAQRLVRRLCETCRQREEPLDVSPRLNCTTKPRIKLYHFE